MSTPRKRFTPTPKRFRVTFEAGHELEDLEFVTRSVPISTVVTVLRSAGAGAARAASVEDVEGLTGLFDAFGGALIEWNMDYPPDHAQAGEPVPPTAEGVSTLDLDLVTTLAMQWIDAVLGAAAPLAQNSTGGGSEPRGFPRVSLPMTPL